MKRYKQFYTSSLFNIENNIDYNLNTTFINVFTNNDLKVFNKINNKQVVYNSELHFFNYLNIVKTVIKTNVLIFSNSINIRKYLFENGANPIFIINKYNVSKCFNNIFIYNGKNKNIHNQRDILNKLKQDFPTFTFFISNELNISHDELFKLYSSCFVEINLINEKNQLLNDEYSKLFIPLIENLTSTGLKWKTYDDIKKYIDALSYKKIYETDDEYIIQLFGYYGYPVISNKNLFNTINKFEDSQYNDYIKNINLNYEQNYKKIKNIIIKKNKKKLKDETPLIYIPIWGRENIVEININLLKLQTIEPIIVLGVSNEEDKKLAIKLNVDYVYCENKPLGMKNQILLSYSKIYNSKYMIYHGSDDYLSLNFIEDTIKYIKKGNDFVGLNNWFMITDNQVYELNYVDKNKSIGSGRVFNSDIFDKINWNYYPLNKARSIDFHSFIKIENICKSIILNDKNIKIILKKHNQQMISSESVYFVSSNCNYNICDDNLLKNLVKINDCNQIINLFKNNCNKKYAYITFFDNEILNKHYISRLQIKLVELLKYKFDIIQLNNITNLDSYDKIIIDGCSLNPRICNFNVEQIQNFLKPIIEKKNFLLFHDLHDWSLGFIENPNSNEKFEPILKDTNAKQELSKFLINYNIKDIISIYDCPEYNFFKEYLKSCVNNFYTLHHFISTPIFNVPNKINKDIDILFYGWDSDVIYPFRNYIKKLCEKTNFKVEKIKRVTKYDPNICEEGLAKYITRSWISIACISNYDYAVRKYNEISECGSIVFGNINPQLSTILDNNMIIINEEMSDNRINEILNYYLTNKILLVYLGFRVRESILKFNDNNYINNLYNIVENKYKEPVYKIEKKNYIYKYQKIDIKNDNLRELKKTNLNIKKNIINVKILQEDSTPGIIINIDLNKGEYIFSFIIDKKDEYSINFFTELNYYRKININDITYIFFIIENKGNYNFYINNIHPKINKEFNITNLELFRFSKEIEHNKNLYITSKGCPNLSLDLSKELNTKFIPRDDIWNSNFKDINIMKNNNLFLIGFYDPQKWNEIYKPLLDNFNKSIIIFTGTDICQMNIDYFGYSLRDFGYNEDEREKLINYFINNKKIFLTVENEYIKHEMKSLFNLETEVLPLPSKYINNTRNLIVNKLKVFNKVGVYMPSKDETNWYYYNLLIEIVKDMQDIQFYFYKKGGYIVNEIEKNLKNLIPCEVIDMNQFLDDKLCNIRITLHDGEPLTGVETIIFGRKFIFNFPMKHAEYVEPNKMSIINKIREIQLNYEIDYEKIKYYSNRNSIKSLNKALTIYYNLINTENIMTINYKNINSTRPNQKINIYNNLNDNFIDYAVIESKQEKSTPGIVISFNIKVDIEYYITIFGYSESNTNFFGLNNNAEIIEKNYYKMNIYYSPIQIKLIGKINGIFELLFSMENPNIGDKIFIEKILINEIK